MPDLTDFLAQVFGLAFIILGTGAILRYKGFIPAVEEFTRRRALRLVVSVLEIIVGLMIIVSHNIWSPFYAVIVTLMGWLFLLEGVFYLLTPQIIIERVVAFYNKPLWYKICGSIAIIVGIFLALSGFGIIS